MSGQVKKSREKIITVDEIIDKILKDRKLKIEKFAVDAGISIDALRKSIERNTLSDNSVEKIRDSFHIKEDFLRGFESELSYEKPTPVQNGANNTGKPIEGDPEVYRTIVEGKTEYVLVPREVMQDSKLIAKDQFTETIEMMKSDREMMKSDRRIMEILMNKFLETAEKLMHPAQPMQPQKGKNNS
jgi:hypothetical protein